MKHWTENSIEDFRYRVATDFITDIEARLECLGWSQSDLANRINLSEGRVSQVLNNPGNLTLDSIIEWARAVGMKVSMVAYEDGDTQNLKGPVHSEIFRMCWEKAGKPSDRWEFDGDQSGETLEYPLKTRRTPPVDQDGRADHYGEDQHVGVSCITKLAA
jgi:transcriptional regulator with XRE-family HTH domain